MTDAKNIAAIAAGLTRAQKRVIKAMIPGNWHQPSEREIKTNFNTMWLLRGKSLHGGKSKNSRLVHASLAFMGNWIFKLTPLGIAVRKALLEDSNNARPKK